MKRQLTKGQIWYQRVYLKSDHWRGLRDRTIKGAGGRCQDCGSNDRVQVHHLNYDNLWHEKPDDIRVLCRFCHRDVHGLVRDLERHVENILHHEDRCKRYSQREAVIMAEVLGADDVEYDPMDWTWDGFTGRTPEENADSRKRRQESIDRARGLA